MWRIELFTIVNYLIIRYIKAESLAESTSCNKRLKISRPYFHKVVMITEILDKQTMKMLSVDTRKEIIKLLSERPYTASELAKILGKHITTVSEHLDMLERSDIARKKDNDHKWKYYTLTASGERLLKPNIYSWIIVLSLSFVCLLFGSLQLFGRGGLEKANDVLAASAAEYTAPLQVDIVLGSVMIGLAVIGIAYVIWDIRNRYY